MVNCFYACNLIFSYNFLRNSLKITFKKLSPKINFILGDNAVESPRIELGSKQATKSLSTRLVFN